MDSAAKRVKMNPELSGEAMWESLGRDGYVVVRGVLGADECERADSLLWGWLREASPGLARWDASTWTGKNRLPHAGGLIQHQGVGWCPASVMVRELVKPVFEKLYNTRELWTSLDGVSVTMKPATRCKYASLADWEAKKWEGACELPTRRGDRVHVDQTTLGPLLTVQGGVALNDQHENEHVFLCVPGSHRLREPILALGPLKKQLHWEMMNQAQLDLLQAEGLDLVRVPLSKGDLVLWRSDLVHSSSGYCADAPASAHRAHVFVCMLPQPADPVLRAKEMAKRVKAYAGARTGKHSPHPLRLFPVQPRTYGKPQLHLHVPPPPPLTDEQKRLHGLIPY